MNKSKKNKDKALYYRVKDNFSEEITFKQGQKMLRMHQVGADRDKNVPDSENSKSRGWRVT